MKYSKNKIKYNKYRKQKASEPTRIRTKIPNNNNNNIIKLKKYFDLMMTYNN